MDIHMPISFFCHLVDRFSIIISYSFANIGNLNQLDDTLSVQGGSRFWNNLDLELWSDSGWCTREFWISRIMSESVLTIFLISCIELGVNKGFKSIESDFSKKTSISRYGAIRAEKCRITDSIRIQAETTLRIWPICET